jgi:hypothetical protein
MLPNGAKFDGPSGLRQSLMRHADVFVGTMSSKLLPYALGRGLEYYDAPAVREIMRDAAESKYSFSSIILGIVDSVPFQMRHVAEEAPPASTVAAVARR